MSAVHMCECVSGECARASSGVYTPRQHYGSCCACAGFEWKQPGLTVKDSSTKASHSGAE